MQIDAITRKSSLPAILLFLLIVVGALIRATSNPLGVEVAEFPFRERTISFIIAAVVLCATSLVVGRLFMRTGLSKSFCTLPIPRFGILAYGIAVPPHLLASSVAATLLALALLLLCQSIENADERNAVFVGALLLGVMPLLNPTYITLLAVLPIVALLFALSARQIFIMVVGYLLPLCAASYVVWYGGGEITDVAENIIEQLSTPLDFNSATIPYGAIAIVVWCAVIVLWGVIYSIIKPNKMFLVARVRRTLYLFLLLTLLLAATAFIPYCGLSLLPVFGVVGAVLISFTLSLLPTRESTIAYWILLALFVVHLFVE